MRALIPTMLLLPLATWSAPAQTAMSRLDVEVADSTSMRESHPDQHYRKLGADAYKAGRTEEARRYYQMAARYADKLSQAALAEMCWNGEGGDADHALAYVWMDMAAERGLPLFVAKREHYWKQLDEDERRHSVQVGRKLYAKYGDPSAKPRLERVLRVQRNQVAGSRLGFIGTSETYLPGTNGGYSRVASASFYQDRFWKPDAYWKAQDELMGRQGQVQIGAVENTSPDGSE
ncbi:MAG TPA: hypothetical protein DDZ67_05895 [Xanthomonadaceae bacterium]|nr:hypothetical protein [Xanthomonadaceae bacterium]